MMLSDDEHALLRRLAAAVRNQQITQLQIASATGVHQSQVSRILSGDAKRLTPNVKALCKYASKRLSGREADSTASGLAVTAAAMRLWDGTTEHAEVLVSVLNAMGAVQDVVRKMH
jgi:transcriptional regulator with XRE-family HTH domain